MIISIVYHHLGIPKRKKNSSELVFGNLPPGWLVFCFVFQMPGVNHARPMVFSSEHPGLRQVSCDHITSGGLSWMGHQDEFRKEIFWILCCNLHTAYLLGRSIEQMESPAIIWWKDESIFLCRFSTPGCNPPSTCGFQGRQRRCDTKMLMGFIIDHSKYSSGSAPSSTPVEHDRQEVVFITVVLVSKMPYS